jgi:hypothetical protein
MNKKDIIYALSSLLKEELEHLPDGTVDYPANYIHLKTEIYKLIMELEENDL